MKKRHRHRCRHSEGFTLVEVALSMAIMSFAMISVLGLVPMGLTHFRQAMNNTVESQIVQSITSELQLTSYSQLKNATTYYDAEGGLTSSSNAIYIAVLTLQPVTGTSFAVDISATANSAAIQVGRADATKTQPLQPNTYCVILANQNN